MVCYRLSSPPSKMIFGDGCGNWVIEISKEGIKLNRDHFHNFTPEDFAQAFFDILEKNYTVTFEKRK